MWLTGRRALWGALVVCLPAFACGPAESPGQAAFARLSDEFLAWYFADDPVRATGLGVHLDDGAWPDVSAAGFRRRADELRAWLARVEEIPRAELAGDAWFDHRILEYGIRDALLEIDEIRGWRRDPNYYNRLAARGISALVDREFAPASERAGRLAERLESLPALLDSARENLDDVPRIWADMAVANVAGTRAFFERTVVAAVERQAGPGLEPAQRERLVAARDIALRSLESFERWIAEDLTPRANGDFRLGADLFLRKLRYEEHVEIDLDTLREMNRNAIRDYRDWVAKEAAKIDERTPAAEVMNRIAQRFPAADALIATAERNVEQAKEFVVEREIVTLPADTLPVIRPTPEFARSGFASMSTPGPFEKVATEAYFNITLPDPDWSDRQRREHLTYFNYPGLLGVSIHEVMPGHYVQLLYRQRVPTALRRVFMSGTLIEGWAHYTEQMMIDEGLGGGNPAVRLGQLRRALQRHARWQATMALHVDGDNLLDAAVDFAKTAYFADFPALRETRRATHDPMYLVYALGRLEILRLREDYRAAVEARGETFRLRDFHDRLLELGLPLPLAREALIPSE